MRIATYRHAGIQHVGLVSEHIVRSLELGGRSLRDALAADGPEGLLGAAPTGEPVDLNAVELLAPVPDPPRNVFAVGWNYVDHFAEGAAARSSDTQFPDHPTFFTKPATTLIGAAADVQVDPQLSERVDFEAELCVVVGRAGRSIPQDKALDHVFGYTLANDVSARDIQRAHGGQWFRGKAIDGSCPLGPWIVTADELPDPQRLTLGSRVNGEQMQHASTADMAFPVARIIAELSRGITLLPGDLIITGTPSGVGYARDPARFLTDGDEVTVFCPQIGELANRVRRADLTSYRPA